MTGGPAVDMPTSTTFELPGYTVERTLGLSWGLIVRSVGLTKGLTGTVRSLKAGEVKEFTEVVDRARRTALERLIDHARQLGGNAVLGVRFDSSDLGNGLAETSPTAPPPPSGQPEPAPDDEPVAQPLVDERSDEGVERQGAGGELLLLGRGEARDHKAIPDIHAELIARAPAGRVSLEAGPQSAPMAPRHSSWNERFGEDPCPPGSPISTHWRYSSLACAV